jgi:hypothetical protein
MALSIPIITEYVGTGLDKFKKELAQAETSTQKAGLVIKKAMLPATAAIGALGVALFDAAEGALADEKAAKELARSLKATTNATDAIVESTEDWITEQGRLLGVSDDQLRPALSRLARATGDVQKAQELVSQAMDISVATGKPLETVVGALEKAYGGNLTALQRLAPEYRDLIKSGASFEEVMSALAKTTGGAAAEAATTAEGRFRILKLQLDETKEAIGASIIPVIEEALPVLEDFADWAQDNPENFKNIAAAIGAIAASVVLLNGAMKASIFFKATGAIGGIGVLVAGFAAAYASIESFRVKVNAQYNSWVGMLEGVINTAVRTVNPIIDALNKASPGNPFARLGLVSIPRLDTRLESQKGSGFEGLNIPQMADGGIVTGPTLALIGEAGPEAVVPLDRAGGMGGINITVNAGLVSSPDQVGQQIIEAIQKAQRRSGPVFAPA